MRKKAVLLVGALAVTVLMGPASADHQQQSLLFTGSISGHVSNAEGNGVADICVSAYASSFYAYSSADLNGDYLLTDLPPDHYRVEFYDCNYERAYMTEWYNDKASYEAADPISVGLNEAVTGIDATLVEGGRISGVVTNTSGDPVTNACIDVVDNDYNYIGYRYTDNLGKYEIGGLTSGDYKVSFYCAYPYDAEWYNDKPSFETADAVQVVIGATTTAIDAVLSGEAPPPPPPLPSIDLAVTDITFESVPVTTDYGDIGYTGWQRKVDVSIANLSGADGGSASLTVEACAVGGGCRTIGSTNVGINANSQTQESFYWDGAGSFGDVEVRATIRPRCYYETDWSNNSRVRRHYVIVGGTGFGYDLTPDDGSSEEEYAYACLIAVKKEVPPPSPSPLPL